MIDHQAMAERLLAAWEAGGEAPPAGAEAMDMEAAYAVQVEVLRRHRAAGRAQRGWKIGQTSPAMRAANNETTPAMGFLLAEGGLESGARLDLSGAQDWFLEAELAFVLARDLRGPGITPEQARAAVGQVVPAFELVRRHGRFAQRTLQRALNASQAGYVLGTPHAGCPEAAALDALPVRVTRDGAPQLEARGGDVNDNPLASTAWLANRLAAFGEHLTAGQVVLTGSYSPLLPLRPGERWAATFGDLGEVTLPVA